MANEKGKEMEDNYSSYQLDRLVQEIESRLNDYEGGISEKDETIKSFAFFIGECAKNAVNNALAEYRQSILALVNKEILQNAIKHDNAMANVKPEAFEFFEELYKLRLVFLDELRQKIEAL